MFSVLSWIIPYNYRFNGGFITYVKPLPFFFSFLIDNERSAYPVIVVFAIFKKTSNGVIQFYIFIIFFVFFSFFTYFLCLTISWIILRKWSIELIWTTWLNKKSLSIVNQYKWPLLNFQIFMYASKEILSQGWSTLFFRDISWDKFSTKDSSGSL